MKEEDTNDLIDAKVKYKIEELEKDRKYSELEKNILSIVHKYNIGDKVLYKIGTYDDRFIYQYGTITSFFIDIHGIIYSTNIHREVHENSIIKIYK